MVQDVAHGRIIKASPRIFDKIIEVLNSHSINELTIPCEVESKSKGLRRGPTVKTKQQEARPLVKGRLMP
jgi:hypothetical protein